MLLQEEINLISTQFNIPLFYFVFQTLQRRMAELDENGPASPSTLGQQLITKKVAMVTVKQRLQEYQNLLGDLKERVKKIEQILEEELGRREKSKKDIGVIKIWITKTIQVIERKLDSSEPVDVTTIEVGLKSKLILFILDSTISCKLFFLEVQ